MSALLANGGVEPFEQGHPLGEDLVIVVGRREQGPDRHIDAPRFLVGVFAITKIRLVNHLREPVVWSPREYCTGRPVLQVESQQPGS